MYYILVYNVIPLLIAYTLKHFGLCEIELYIPKWLTKGQEEDPYRLEIIS